MCDMTLFEEQAMRFLEKEEWYLLCDLLESTFKVEKRICTSAIKASESSLKVVDELLNSSTIKILNKLQETNLVFVKHLFKALRNSMTFDNVNYAFIIDESSILANSYTILQTIGVDSDTKCVECIKMLLQFLINLIVGNPACAERVWLIFSPAVQELIKNETYSYYASALTYNIFHNNPVLASGNNSIFEVVFNAHSENEYLTFLLEHFVSNKEVNCTYIEYTKAEHRILFLQTLQQVLKDKQSAINADLIMVISSEFKQKSDCILKTVDSYLQDIEPVEVSLLADVLASLSSEEKYLAHLQVDKSLLINCAFLLKSIHSLGRASQNEFTPIEKLSELRNLDDSSLSHPAFGFKAALIRMLGNLVWKNKVNQDEMRELECIPLLLDCCNIDAKNPFIIQWVIFAIRNLCEANIENQRYIANMNNKGVVSSAALHEMGVTLHSDGVNQIKIVPLDLKK